MRWIRTRKGIAAIGGLLGIIIVLGMAQQVLHLQVGRQPDDSVVLETNQVITPVGRQVEFLGRPMAATLSPDRNTVAVLNAYGEAIVLIEPESGVVKQIFKAAENSASFTGILYAKDGTKLYASQANGKLIVATVADDGMITLDRLLDTPSRKDDDTGGALALSNAYPGGLALSEDGETLYVALNRNNTLGVLDVESGEFTSEINVGNAPHDVIVVGDTAYVSNRGGRPAKPGDFTVESSDTPIVADEEIGYATTGTVSVVDLEAGKQVRTIKVGLHPGAMLLDGSRIFVANAASDTVSVIDTRTNKVVRSLAVKPFSGALLGSSPNALAMIGKDRLAVSLGRNNAVAIYNMPTDPTLNPMFEGLIPVGFYPIALIADREAQRLIVANGKGVGSLGPSQTVGPNPETNKTGKYVHSMLGSVSIMNFPDREALQRHTKQVAENNGWNDLQPTQAAKSDAEPVPIPQNVGEPSVFKHVFYIIRENRTYDQILGDMPQGNGDPSLVQFGRKATPNAHALAEQFGLLDNVYASGLNSADGHQWSTQAFVNDYLERSFGGFTRSYPFNGGDSLAYTPSGFLWDNALGHDKTVRNYGEYVIDINVDGEPLSSTTGTWSDWYRDAQILAGNVQGDPHVQELVAHSDIPSLESITNKDYPPYTMLIPDQYRVEVFLKEFNEYVQNGDLPDLVMMHLTNDHTAGTSEGFPTPRAMVADNDLALGRVVEAISNSPYWKDSLIVVIEDDAQNGVDHVSGHRMPAFVISAYSKRGIVDSNYYTQINFIRTMEQILGLPPMNQMDMAVDPDALSGLFMNEPDLTPYKAVPNQIPLDELNPVEASLSELPRLWSTASANLKLRLPDVADKQILNRVNWYSTEGFDTPYPGDPRVFRPDEVHPYLKAVGRDTVPRPDYADMLIKRMSAMETQKAGDQRQAVQMLSPDRIGFFGDGR